MINDNYVHFNSDSLFISFSFSSLSSSNYCIIDHVIMSGHECESEKGRKRRSVRNEVKAMIGCKCKCKCEWKLCVNEGVWLKWKMCVERMYELWRGDIEGGMTCEWVWWDVGIEMEVWCVYWSGNWDGRGNGGGCWWGCVCVDREVLWSSERVPTFAFAASTICEAWVSFPKASLFNYSIQHTHSHIFHSSTLTLSLLTPHFIHTLSQ
jgi:hypothetical protein